MGESSADKLLARMREWAEVPIDTSIAEARAVNGDWWAPHVETLQWLFDVEQQVEQAKKDDPNLALAATVLDDIHKAIFGDVNPMFSKNLKYHQLLFKRSLETLALLTSTLNAKYKNSVPLDALDMFTMTDELASFVNDTYTLNLDDSRYLLSIIEKLRAAIQSCAIEGKEKVRDLASQLVGAMVFYMGDKNPEKFKDIVNRFGRATATFLSLKAPTEIGIGLAVGSTNKEIEM